MATIRLVPSSYSVSNSNYVSFSDSSHPASNMYTNTDSTTYATIRGRNSSQTSRIYYCYINGFNFDDVPSNATVSNFSIKIKAYKNSYQRTGTNYRPKLASSASNNSVISDTTLSSDLTTTSGGTVYTFPTGNLTWNTLKNYGSDFSIVIPLNPSSNQYPYVYVYGIEIEVTYSVETVHPTSVSLDKNTLSLEVSDTEQLTATVLPATSSDKSVTWSSNNTSVATVNSSGLVTAVGAGTATITVTTTDGNYTASCAVTVTTPTYIEYELATTLEAGKSYLIANGNSGSVYLLSNESPGSGQLNGVSVTVSNNIISITSSVNAKCLFDCSLLDNSNQDSTILKNGSNYLYTDSSNRLRIASYTSSMDGKHWHYKADSKNLLWFFKDGTDNDGYTDTSSTYKYYLTVSNGIYADAYVSTTSLSNTTTPAIYLYTERSATPVNVTGVDVSPSTSSIEINGTVQLTATVSPSNATNKSVTWSSNNTSIATVSNSGLVTGISAGTTRITATTTDGSFTDYCDVTVTTAVTYTYKLATSLTVGKNYLIANGNTGSVYLLTNESGGDRQLVGVAATVSNNKITITGTVKAKAEFECVRYTTGNDITITVKSNNQYLYSDSGTGLRMNSPTTLDRFWHYENTNHKFWQFKSTTTNGYTDTSSEYKYYLELNNSNNYTDNHLTSPSIEDTTLPEMYLFVEDDGSGDSIVYMKINETWTQCSKVYKKISGSWVEQTDLTNVFENNVNYIKN